MCSLMHTAKSHDCHIKIRLIPLPREATCRYCDLRYCGLVRENKFASSFHFPDSPQGGAWPLTCGLRRECFRPDDGR